MSNLLHLISNIKLNTINKKKEAYFFKRKDCIVILNILWAEKLIWGYKQKDLIIKIYFRYYLNKSVIKSIEWSQNEITLKNLKLIIQKYPQSIFIIKTNNGYKTGKDCLKKNISGILALKIN